MAQKEKITVVEIKVLQQAFDFYNKKLFGNSLPDCIITLSHERIEAVAFCAESRYIARNGKGRKISEIALNPAFFFRSNAIIFSDLVHEMCHLWQYHRGKPSRNGYHNKEWADKMESIGLMPSNTGKPGGKKTGQSLDDYIIKNGPFSKATKNLLDSGLSLNWKSSYYSNLEKHYVNEDEDQVFDPEDPEPTSAQAPRRQELREYSRQRQQGKKNKPGYHCPNCKINVWGKPNLNLICGDCNAALVEEK